MPEGKHVVISTHAGVMFPLPVGHGIANDESSGYATLSEGSSGSVYLLLGVEEGDQGLIVSLGEEVSQWAKRYPLPPVADASHSERAG